MEYAISVEDLHKSFGDKEILKGISLHTAKGEVTAIIGPSGSGKTTLLRSMNLLETPDSGVITIGGVSVDCGKKIKHADALALRRQTAMVFQDYNLFKNKTALQNITQGLRTVKRSPRPRLTKSPANNWNWSACLISPTITPFSFPVVSSSVFPSHERWL